MFGQMEENLAFAQRHTRAALVGIPWGAFRDPGSAPKQAPLFRERGTIRHPLGWSVLEKENEMTKSNNGPATASNSPDQGAKPTTDAALDPSVTPTQTAPDDAVSQEARKEALRNANRGDQFVVATDLEDSEQREAAPGTREQD